MRLAHRPILPANMSTPRLDKSIRYYRDSVTKHLISHDVDPKAIVQLRFLWPAGQRKRMVAVDDRGKEHKNLRPRTQIVLLTTCRGLLQEQILVPGNPRHRR